MPADLVQVEVAGEEVVLVLRAEGASTRSRVRPQGAAGPRCSEHGHDLGAGPLVGRLEDRPWTLP